MEASKHATPGASNVHPDRAHLIERPITPPAPLPPTGGEGAGAAVAAAYDAFLGGACGTRGTCCAFGAAGWAFCGAADLAVFFSVFFSCLVP